MYAKRAGDNLPGAGLAGAVIAVACCAGLPPAAALIGGVTIAALLGVAAGLVALVGLAAAIALAVRAGDAAPTRRGSRHDDRASVLRRLPQPRDPARSSARAA